jgi:hypothetical protein
MMARTPQSNKARTTTNTKNTDVHALGASGVWGAGDAPTTEDLVTKDTGAPNNTTTDTTQGKGVDISPA